MWKLGIAMGKMWFGTMWILFPMLLTMTSPLWMLPIVSIYPFSTLILLSLLILYFLIQPFRFVLLIFSFLTKFPTSLLHSSTTYFSFAHVRFLSLSLSLSFKYSFTKFFLHWGFSFSTHVLFLTDLLTYTSSFFLFPF